MTVLQTLAYDVIDDAQVIFHAPGEPTEQDFQRLLADTRRIAPCVRASLVLAGNAALTRTQRRQISTVLRGTNVKVAVLAGSPGVHLSAAALRTLGHDYRIFGRHDLDQAIEHLGFCRDTRRRTHKVVAEFRTTIDPRFEVCPESAVGASAAPAGILTGIDDFSRSCGLSRRESEAVLALVSTGSRVEIAERMGVSEGSVHTYLSRACKKVGITSEMDLLRAIIRYLDEQLARGQSRSQLDSTPGQSSNDS